jgi:hypothetical protein
MGLEITALFKSLCEAITGVAKVKATSIEHQLETEMLHDNDNYIEAIDFAEKAFDLIAENNGYLDDKNFKTFKYLKTKFDNHKRG